MTTQEQVPTQPSEDNHDIFLDPALANAAQDPLLGYFVKRWRPILLVIVAVFAGAYIRQTFRNSYELSLGQSADGFSKVRTEYAEMRAHEARILTLRDEEKKAAAKENKDEKKEDATKREEAAKKRTEEIASLEKKISENRERLNQFVRAMGETEEPYKTIAKVYQGLIAGDAGDLAGMKSAYAGLKFDPSLGDSTDGFYRELASIALARKLLDSPDGAAEGKEMLSNLAEKGSYVNVSAALTLAHIAVSDDDKKKTAEQLLKLVTAHPEQAKFLESEIKRLQ